MENITPIFKEKEDFQYAFRDGIWHEVDESTIDALWQEWVIRNGARKYLDSEGFTVFGYVEVNNDL